MAKMPARRRRYGKPGFRFESDELHFAGRMEDENRE
jgi:hypothetical protein